MMSYQGNKSRTKNWTPPTVAKWSLMTKIPFDICVLDNFVKINQKFQIHHPQLFVVLGMYNFASSTKFYLREPSEIMFPFFGILPHT